MEEQFSDTHKESSQLGSQPKVLDGCYGHQLQIVIMVEVQRMGGGGRRIEREQAAHILRCYYWFPCKIISQE